MIVSAIAYHSKVSFMERLPSIDSKLISLFNSFGTTFSDIPYAGEKIFISMYDLINSCNNLTDLRYTKFSKAIAKTNLVPERLPPTYKAAVHHSPCVYLQIMQWANLDYHNGAN